MSESPARYAIVQEPQGHVYRGLLRFLVRFCNTALVVEREPGSIAPAVQAVLTKLEPFLMSSRDESRWPGTELIGHTARVYCYTLTSRSCDILCSSVGGLYGWISPDFPEDLCILKDGTPWLTTVAHEREAYLDLPATQYNELQQAIPGLVLFPGDFMPRSKELYRLFGGYLGEYPLGRGMSVDAALARYVTDTSAELVEEAIASIPKTVFALKSPSILRVVLERLGASTMLLDGADPSSMMLKVADQLQLRKSKRGVTQN
jgi:hypothetical protein